MNDTVVGRIMAPQNNHILTLRTCQYVTLHTRGHQNCKWSYHLELPLELPISYLKEIILNYQGGGFPGGSVSKEPACNTGDLGSIPESGRSPEEGNGNPLQCSCLENPMD